MASWEAIVVGGGPGGSTAAWRLALTGVRTLVLDAAVFPRVKICAGWVTPAALTDLELDPEKYPLTIQGFAACALAYRGARHETRWRRPASYGIIRREFDQYLLERAAAAGADVRDGIRVRAVAAGAESVRVETDAGAYEAAVVIGAGGHRCPVAQSLGDVSLREEVVVAQESETRLPAGRLAGLQHLRYHKHEVVVFHVLDAAELDFPFRHTTLFRGLEGLPEILTDPLGVRESYLRALNEHVEAITAGCRGMEIDYVRLRTDADLGHDLAAYLQKRRGK